MTQVADWSESPAMELCGNSAAYFPNSSQIIYDLTAALASYDEVQDGGKGKKGRSYIVAAILQDLASSREQVLLHP